VSLDKLRLSLDPDRPLDHGFARVHRQDGALARRGADLVAGEVLSLRFGDRVERKAVVDGGEHQAAAAAATTIPAAAPARVVRPKARGAAAGQGDLF
jgi:exodeoxyribonuclease VII large subunit